jgi:Ca2+-dependent lipid-binding protein
LSARDLKAADKSGTSDPYVVFFVNGVKEHKSETIRKTLNPKWKGERFSVQIVSGYAT